LGTLLGIQEVFEEVFTEVSVHHSDIGVTAEKIKEMPKIPRVPKIPEYWFIVVNIVFGI
jgi:hypothetical protein